MLPQKPLLPLHNFSAQQFNAQNYQAEKKNKNADPVNTVHVTDPFVFWTVRIFFFQIEVLRYLFPDSHTFYITNIVIICFKIN